MQGIYNMSGSDLPESNTFRCCFQSHLDSWCSSEHALHSDGNQFPGTTLWNLIHRQQYTSVYNILYLTCLACHPANTVCTNCAKDNFPRLHLVFERWHSFGAELWSFWFGDCRPGQLQLQVEVLQSLLRMKRSVLQLQAITAIHESRCKLCISEISLSVILLMIYNISYLFLFF